MAQTSLSTSVSDLAAGASEIVVDNPRTARQATFIYVDRFEEIGDPSGVEIGQFRYGRCRYSLRYSEALGSLNVWLPLNVEDRFIGAIERVDSRLPVIRAHRLTDWSKDDTDQILRAALAVYDQHLSTVEPP